MKSSITKTRPPASFNRCLFCLGSCYVPTVGFSSGDKAKLTMVGARHCETLNKQLEQIFISRKLLDLPVEWCEETLKKQQKMQDNKKAMVVDLDKDEEETTGSGNDEQDCIKSGNACLWFNVCTKCFKCSVQPAWDIYQKIVALEAKLNTIKLNIKTTMEQSILRNKRSKRWSGFSGEGVDREIRTFIFPGLQVLDEDVADELQKIKESVNPRPRPSYTLQQQVDLAEQDPDFQGDMDWDPPSVENFDDNDDDEDADASFSTSNMTKVATNKSKTAATRKKGMQKRKYRRKEDVQNFLCSQCGCYLNTKARLARHLEAHERSNQTEGGGPFDCSKCSFPAQSQDQLQNHVKNHHDKVRFYPCPWCDFRGKTFKKLKAHVGVNHPSVSEEEMAQAGISLTCHICSRTFIRLEAFALHKKKSHPELFGAELNEPLECKHCGQKFVSKIMRDYHMIREHTERPKKFVCDVCGKVFRWKNWLERHQIMHVKKVKRDHVCHLCGVDYAYRDTLMEHYRKIHPEKEDDAQGGLKLDQPSTAEEFKCRYCELTSPYKVVIQRHLQTHKEEMGHRCGQCGNCYTSDAGLKRHLRLNHSTVKMDVPCPYCRKSFTSVDGMKDHLRWCKLKNVEQQESVVGPAPAVQSSSSGYDSLILM